MPGSIALERRGDVALLRLDNPPVNGLSFAMRAALGERMAEALADDTVAAIVVCGAGRMFCGGADIREFSAPPPPGAAHLPAILDDIEASPKPVVAAIHGVAAGGGMELALACHVRLAAPGTRLGLPEVTLGILPGAGGTQRLTKFVGKSKAMEMSLTGRMMDAEEAERSGLVSRIVPLDDLVDEAVRTAEAIAKQSRPAVYMTIESIDRAYETPLREGVLFERRMFHAAFATDDRAEGMAAFIEKREPKFRNR